MNFRIAWLVSMAVLVGGCRSTMPAPSNNAAQFKDLPLEIHWVRNSAEYQAIFEQTFRLAGDVVERRAEGRAPGTWAVAVDADETLISNSLQSKERALGDGAPFEEVWDEWVNRREAPALPGAKAFLERVRDLGGAIAVVTNRRAHHCQATSENLDHLGMPYDVILCRHDDGDKTPRWQSVEQGMTGTELPPVEILMWVGDNIRDFPGLDQDLRFKSSGDFTEFGERFFVLPNPLYGSWEDNTPD